MFVFAAACLFFADVFVRRVNFGFEWMIPAWAWVRTRVWGVEKAEEQDETMDRLRSRKAEIAESIDERRAAARFELVPDDIDAPPPLEELMDGGAPTRPGRTDPSTSIAPEEEQSYTSRLLDAKKKAWKDKKDKQ